MIRSVPVACLHFAIALALSLLNTVHAADSPAADKSAGNQIVQQVQQSVAQGEKTKDDSQAAPIEKDGDWLIDRFGNNEGRRQTMELTLHPRAEPRPALKYRLIEDDYHLLDGNAALFYLKAEGFIDQDNAHTAVQEFRKKFAEQAKAQNLDIDRLPPHVWLETAPRDYPQKDVHDYLNLMKFQTYYLEEAAKRRSCDFDRQIDLADNPIGYLLPEIQQMRDLARTQRIRCRLAISENRIDDAIAILGQQCAMAKHLGDDIFLISNLVGCAIYSVSWEDMLYLVQQADAPNLYWALAALPSPLVDMTKSNAFESQFLYSQVKVLKEVTEELRPAGYWRDFLDRLALQIHDPIQYDLTSLPGDWKDPDALRQGLVAYVALAYPGAKRYLIEEWGMSPEKVNAYPTAQVVFLAARKFYDESRDNLFKWDHVPYWQVRNSAQAGNFSNQFELSAHRLGWAAMLTSMILPAQLQAREAQQRVEQKIALIKTVEAIRLYGAANDGKLPDSLDDLTVPAPLEPFTGKPVQYEVDGDSAMIIGHPLIGIQYRLRIRFANTAE